MEKQKSYILANLEEKIRFLNAVNYDYQVIKNPLLSTSKLHEIRRQFNLGSYKEALRKQIEDEIRENLRYHEYSELCEFLMANGFESDITLIPSEELRVKYLKRMENQTSKAKVLSSLDDDELKIEYLSGLKKESDKMIVLCSLSTDERKIEYFDRITDYHKQAELVASLDSDALKLEYILSGKIRPYSIADVLATLKDDKKKEELMDLVLSDTARFRVIISIKDDATKERLFEEKIQAEAFKIRKEPALILSFSIDEQLRRFDEFNDGIKVRILQNCDFETQIKLLSMIEDDEKKKVIFDKIPAEFLFKYMAYNYGDTTNFWVRTDSEEREANIPRDDREAMVAEIVRFSSIPDANKVALIHTYVKDKSKIKELLSLMPEKTVISEYFKITADAINISMLPQIQEIYNLDDMYDVCLTADRDFDFDNPANQELINKVKQMKYPKFLLDKTSYEAYLKWRKIFEDSDIILSANMVDISEATLSLEELKNLVTEVKSIKVNKDLIEDAEHYYRIVEFLRNVFPLGEDEKFDTVRSEVEEHLTSEWLGLTLVKSKETFLNAGFSPEEVQKYGERLTSALYDFGIEKRVITSLALDGEAIEVLHEWDASHSILKNDLEELSCEMTKDGLKKAVQIALAENFVTEEFAVSYLLNYLSTKNIPANGFEYAQKIVLELIESQGLSVNDVKPMNPGAFSDVFSIGDFVLKIGLERETKNVPKHERILPSLLKFEVSEKGEAVSSFLEVQPRVKILGEVSDEYNYGRVMYDVYSDLRDSRIVWGDVAKRNLGFLDKDVTIPENLFAKLKRELEMTSGVTTYHEQGNTFTNRSDISAPYMYVIDTDFLYQIDEEKEFQSLRLPSCISQDYECIYRQIREYKNEKDSQKKRREIQRLKADIDEIFE